VPATHALAPREPGVARKGENPVVPLPADGGHVMSCQLDRDPAQVRLAREHARKALCDWGLGEHADLGELIVSELSTNAIRHGDGPIQVRMSCDHGDLSVEVHDDGAGRPVRGQATPDDEGGRGLALLDGLIALHGGTCGIADDGAGHGKTVYVVICLAAGGPAGAPRRTG
jgi:anti-sigma regulatory factor (Ser/Thr protein kinase)